MADPLQFDEKFREIRHGKKRAFLQAVSRTASVIRSAEIAKIDRSMHYHWKQVDPQYAAAFELAWDRGIDALEAEAVRRAYEGVDEPVYNGGRRAVDIVVDAEGKPIRNAEGAPVMVPAVVRKYSDTLLMFLLNGNRPQKYKQRADLQHSGPNGGPIKTEDVSAVEHLASRIAGLSARGPAETNISGAD